MAENLPRRNLLWELGQLRYREEELDLAFPSDGVDLPVPSQSETMIMEHSVLGLSTGDHVMALYRPWLAERRFLSSEELLRKLPRQSVKVAGLMVVHQAPPTAKGFHFITLEDEAGLIDLIIQPQIYRRYRRLLRENPLLIAEGELQQQDGVVNLLVVRVAPLRAKPVSS